MRVRVDAMFTKLLSKYESEKLLHSRSLSLNTCLKKEEEEEDIDSILTAREKKWKSCLPCLSNFGKKTLFTVFQLLEK